MEMKTIIELCTLNMGQSPNSETYNEHGIGLPFYQGNADFGEIHPNTHIWCSKPVKIANIGDILISVRAPIGALNIADEKCCIGRGLASLTPKYDVCDRMYLYYALHSQVDLLIKQGTGSTFKAIGKKVLEETLIPIYSLEKQKQIAKKFNCIDKAINKRKYQILLLDKFVQSRFVEMFGDMFINPLGWPEAKLDSMADIVSGITKGRKVNTNELYEVPYMAVSNVKAGHINWSTVKTIMATSIEINQYKLQPMDVLMTEGGDPDKVGRGAVIHNPPKNCIHQNHIFRVRLNRNILLPEYMEQYLQNQRAKKYFLGCAKQTTGIASINMRQLRALPVLIPYIELQQKFVQFKDQIDKSKFSTLMSHKNIIKMYQSPLKAA